MSHATPTHEIVSEDLSVGAVLSGRFALSLPVFQRAYAWGQDEAEHLLDDILSALDDSDRDGERTPYFLGTMLFALGAHDQPVRSALVIDGQQRLTTLTILLAVLRDYAPTIEQRDVLHRHIAIWSSPDEWAADSFHLTLRPEDQNFMARAIQKRGATRRARRKSILAARNEAQENIEAVRRLFRRRVGPTLDNDAREKIMTYILESCRALVMRTESLDYAYQIFLTINGRGLPLTDDDIVIAEVIGPLSVDQRVRFKPIIQQMDRYREAAEVQRLRGKTFFSHLVSVSGWSRHSIIRDLRRAVQATGGPMRFTVDIFQPMAEAYLLTRCDFSNQRPSPAVAERLKRLLLLERICDDEWVGVAMLALTRMDATSPELLHFLTRLDRFAHAQLILRPTRDDRRKRYRKIAQAIAEQESIDPDALMALTAGEAKRFVTKCAFGLNETVNRTCKAVLVRLDCEYSGRPVDDYLALFSGDDPVVQDVSVEHVLPRGQRLPRGSAWRSLYPQYEHRRFMANAIGNLVLVDETQNRIAGQKEFAEKKRAYFPSDAPHDFFTTDILRCIDVWAPEALRERHVWLMEKLLATFEFDGEVPLPPISWEGISLRQDNDRPAKRTNKRKGAR
ncbi:MAG: DUF262 domain-containing HNH endonuclease family protein [Pseudomonadota bacterium]